MDLNDKKEELESRNDKLIERYINKSRNLSSKCFQEVELLPKMPDELSYFINVLKTVFIDNSPINYKEGEKFIGCFCSMFPLEIIRAAGARPLLFCSFNNLGTNIGDSVLSSSVCSLAKSIGEISSRGVNKIFDSCSMFIVPLACNCKNQIARELAINNDVMTLQIPFNRTSDEGVNLYTKQLKEIGNKISSITGKKITRKSLNKEIKLYVEAQKEIDLFNELKANDKLLIRGTHALLVLNALSYDDISNWLIHLKKLNEELILKKRNNEYLTNKKLPRILLIGSPISFPNIKVPLIIEKEGGRIVSFETCLADKTYEDYASIAYDNLNDYYRGLANRSIKPSSCYNFADTDVTKNKLEQTIQEKDIDGVIYVSYKRCVSSAVDSQIISGLLKKKNIPFLNIETDLSNDDRDILSMRISAFIEMLN